jgi:threonine aldolase
MEFIKKARKIRKHLGGGMRQAGILAAAGIVALESMVDRLAEDHKRAASLAAGLKNNPGIILDAGTPATNMIFFTLADTIRLSTEKIENKMKEHGILISASGPRRIRLVTHIWIDDAGVEKTIAALQDILN